FNQGMEAAEIPALWNQKYEDYLGITPRNYAEGVLQDSHWAVAAFGYFPTYTLGNLVSGALAKKMEAALPGLKNDIKKGDFSRVLKYLVDNIHSKGRSITSKDVVGELGVDDYLDYLSNKFKG